MNMMVISIILFVVAVIGIKMLPPTDGRIKLGFTPVDGEKSNYMDCEAVDQNGKFWKSNAGVWTKVA